MGSVPHRIGDPFAPLRNEGRLWEQYKIRLLVEVAPEHRNTEPAVGIAVLGKITPSEAQQRSSVVSKNPMDLSEQGLMLFSWHMDDCVVRNDSIDPFENGK
jgi:hypothetical protein